MTPTNSMGLSQNEWEEASHCVISVTDDGQARIDIHHGENLLGLAALMLLAAEWVEAAERNDEARLNQIRGIGKVWMTPEPLPGGFSLHVYLHASNDSLSVSTSDSEPLDLLDPLLHLDEYLSGDPEYGPIYQAARAAVMMRLDEIDPAEGRFFSRCMFSCKAQWVGAGGALPST